MTHSEDGKQYPHGGEELDIKIESPQGCKVQEYTCTCCIQDNKDGTYTATIVPKETGTYKLYITLEGEPIKESPKLMYVHKQTDYSELPQKEKLFDTASEVSDLAVDDKGNVYFVEPKEHRIRVFYKTSGNGRFCSIGCRGSNDGEFKTPHGIVIHKDMLYVTDSENRVQMLTLKGIFKHKYYIPTCTRICFDDFHVLIFVLDSGNKQIYVFEPGLIFRQVINIGSTCKLQICGLASDSGYLYTLHQGSNCINIFTSTGEYVTNYEHMQAREIRPTGIVINEDGYAIIAGSYGETFLYSLYRHVHWTSYLAVVNSSQTNIRIYKAEEVKGIATDKKGTLYVYMYVCGRTTVYRHSYLKKEQQRPALHAHTSADPDTHRPKLY